MRWVLAAVAVLGLAACGPGDEGRIGTTTGRVPGVAGADTSSPARRPVPRARAAAARGTCTARSEREWPPPDVREPTDPPPPPPAVVGRVVDAAGVPVAEARVVCDPGGDGTTARTDARGEFGIPIDSRPCVVRCIAWADGHAVTVDRWRELPDEEDLDVGAIVLGPAARISGCVVDGTGAPALDDCWWVTVDGVEAFGAETWAELASFEDLVERSKPGHAEHASFEFASLPPGRYRLAVRRWSDLKDHCVIVDEVTVVAPAEGVVLRAVDPDDGERPPLELRVRLRRPPGADAPDSPVSFSVDDEAASRIEWSSGDRDERGDLHVVHVWDAVLPLRLAVDGGDGTAGVLDVERSTSRESSIDLHAPAADAPAIVGVVTSGGAPVRWGYELRDVALPSSVVTVTELVGVRVALSAVRTDGDDDEEFHARTAPDGTFRIDGLQDAQYTVFATVAEWGEESRDLACARVLARPGTPVSLEMPEASGRVFRLLPPDGGSPDEIDAWTEPLDGSDDDSRAECSGDAVTVTRLRPGDAYRLVARARVGRTWTSWTRFEGWTAGDGVLDARLDPGLRIEGRVLREDGSPVVGAFLEAEGGPGFDDEVRGWTGLDGRFTLAGVCPGPSRVYASSTGLSMVSAPVATHGGSTGVLVVLRPRPAE